MKSARSVHCQTYAQQTRTANSHTCTARDWYEKEVNLRIRGLTSCQASAVCARESSTGLARSELLRLVRLDRATARRLELQTVNTPAQYSTIQPV